MIDEVAILTSSEATSEVKATKAIRETMLLILRPALRSMTSESKFQRLESRSSPNCWAKDLSRRLLPYLSFLAIWAVEVVVPVLWVNLLQNTLRSTAPAPNNTPVMPVG